MVLGALAELELVCDADFIDHSKSFFCLFFFFLVLFLCCCCWFFLFCLFCLFVCFVVFDASTKKTFD